jgi:hypothetical protein
MSGSTTHTDETTEKAWTVSGHYRDEEFADGFADGGILEGDFAGVFFAATAEEAESLAYEYQRWLDRDSVSVVPGAVEGVPSLMPPSQMPEPAP